MQLKDEETRLNMGHDQKVLIVDDEPRNQRILEEILDGIVGFEVASTGEEALQKADNQEFALVLLDIMMPGIDGYETCTRIRSNPKFSLTKIVLVSGKAMVEERLRGYEVGADDYMTKPFVPEELLAKVKVFLRLAKAEKELLEMNRVLDEKVQERTKQLLDAEAKLVNSAKMSALGEMAGGVAHEINTPLGTIGMIAEQLSELVQEVPMDRATVKDMCRTIEETVQRIGQIIDGLRTFSRDGSLDRFELSSLNQIVEKTMALCQEKLKKGGVKIEIDPIPDDLMIECRPVQISQVLINLIGNACDAISPLSDRWIKISTTLAVDRVEIKITDSGQGISKDVYDKLFQPFFTTKDIGKGTGLGLSISQGILKAHKGSIQYNPECKNTQFVLILPLSMKNAALSP